MTQQFMLKDGILRLDKIGKDYVKFMKLISPYQVTAF
jgi:hypothetical protein